jgi:hypothetical protein
MNVAFEIADRFLARRIIPERDVNLRVDQAGNGRCAAGVDHHVAGCERCGVSGADPLDLPTVGDDRVTTREGLAPVSGDDGADVDDCGPHVATSQMG